MVSVKGRATALLCLLALALGHVDALFLPRAMQPECTHCYRLPKEAENCGVPPEGKYLINHHMPLGDTCELKYAARSAVYFKHDFENVFLAAGTMTTFDRSLIGKSVPISLAGMFDYRDCTFSGTYYSLAYKMNSAFTWVYKKESFSFVGTSVNALKSEVMFGDVTQDEMVPLKRRLFPGPAPPLPSSPAVV